MASTEPMADAVRGFEPLDWKRVAILLSVAAVLAGGHFNAVHRPHMDYRLDMHARILAGNAPSPYQYRVLAPLLAEALARALALALPWRAALIASYAIYTLACIVFFLVMLQVFLQEWFPRDASLLGTLFVGCVMPIALKNHNYQPWSLLHAGLFTAGLLAMHRRQPWRLGLITLAASLNRETAVFLPLAFACTAIEPATLLGRRGAFPRREVLLAGLYGLLWAVPFVGLRLLLGSTEYVHTLGQIASMNLWPESLRSTLVNGPLFLGVFWVFAVLGYRKAPRFVRRVALIVPPYLVFVAVFGIWYEVRLLMPLYPILVACGLSYLYGNADAGRGCCMDGPPPDRGRPTEGPTR